MEDLGIFIDIFSNMAGSQHRTLVEHPQRPEETSRDVNLPWLGWWGAALADTIHPSPAPHPLV